MGDEKRSQIWHDGFMACVQGKGQKDVPGFRGSRIQQLRQMKEWVRGYRAAKIARINKAESQDND